MLLFPVLCRLNVTAHLTSFPPIGCSACQLFSSYFQVTSGLLHPHFLLQTGLYVVYVKISNWHHEQDGTCLDTMERFLCLPACVRAHELQQAHLLW